MTQPDVAIKMDVLVPRDEILGALVDCEGVHMQVSWPCRLRAAVRYIACAGSMLKFPFMR